MPPPDPDLSPVESPEEFVERWIFDDPLSTVVAALRARDEAIVAPLRARIEDLEEALLPFAAHACDDCDVDEDDFANAAALLIANAAALLIEKGEGDD